MQFGNTTAFVDVLRCVEGCGNATGAANFTLISPAVSLNDTRVFETAPAGPAAWVTRPFSLRSPVLAMGARRRCRRGDSTALSTERACAHRAGAQTLIVDDASFTVRPMVARGWYQ